MGTGDGRGFREGEAGAQAHLQAQQQQQQPPQQHRGAGRPVPLQQGGGPAQEAGDDDEEEEESGEESEEGDRSGAEGSSEDQQVPWTRVEGEIAEALGRGSLDGRPAPEEPPAPGGTRREGTAQGVVRQADALPTRS